MPMKTQTKTACSLRSGQNIAASIAAGKQSPGWQAFLRALMRSLGAVCY
jgi:hypothetical protein